MFILFEVSFKKSFKSLAVTSLITTKPLIMRFPKFLHKDLHRNSKGYEKKWQTKMNETLYDLEKKRNAIELDIQALYETLQKEIAQTN